MSNANFVPGRMHCAKCKFQLVRNVLHMQSGTVAAGGNETEPCPNGCGPLWPVTWQQYCAELESMLEEKVWEVRGHEAADESHKVLVRRLDVAMNGEAGAAKQASLCDIVSQFEEIMKANPPTFYRVPFSNIEPQPVITDVHIQADLPDTQPEKEDSLRQTIYKFFKLRESVKREILNQVLTEDFMRDLKSAGITDTKRAQLAIEQIRRTEKVAAFQALVSQKYEKAKAEDDL